MPRAKRIRLPAAFRGLPPGAVRLGSQESGGVLLAGFVLRVAGNRRDAARRAYLEGLRMGGFNTLPYGEQEGFVPFGFGFALACRPMRSRSCEDFVQTAGSP